MTDMEAYMDELKLEIESKCERMKRYAEDIEEMRQTFKFQLNTIPPNIRNMTLKTFAETYKGKVMDVLKEDLVKKQKELDTWVKQTPRLGKNAKEEAIRTRYQLRSSRKTSRRVRRSARIAGGKHSSRVPPSHTGTPAFAKPRTRRTTRASNIKRLPRSTKRRKKDHDRDQDEDTKLVSGSSDMASSAASVRSLKNVSDEKVDTKFTIPESDVFQGKDKENEPGEKTEISLGFLSSGKIDYASLHNMSASKKRNIRANLPKHISQLQELMGKIIEEEEKKKPLATAKTNNR